MNDALRRELVDRVAAVAQDAGVAVDVGDRRLAGRGVHEARVVGDVAGLGQHLRDVEPGRALDRGEHGERQVAVRGGQVALTGGGWYPSRCPRSTGCPSDLMCSHRKTSTCGACARLGRLWRRRRTGSVHPYDTYGPGIAVPRVICAECPLDRADLDRQRPPRLPHFRADRPDSPDHLGGRVAVVVAAPLSHGLDDVVVEDSG